MEYIGKKTKSISLCFPAYNEEQIINKTVKEAIKIGGRIAEDFEVIIVNDGSKDRTGPIIDEWSKKDQRVIAIHHNPNKGYGAAVTKALNSATKDLVFFSDSDLQFDLNEITKLLEDINEYDAVIGYRAIRKDPFIRLLNAKLWNLTNRIFFGLKVKDIDCAFKLFHRKLVSDLKLQSKGAMVSAEMLTKIFDKGYRVKEIPVTHLPSYEKEFGTTGANPRVVLRAFKELFIFWENYKK